MRKFVPRPHPVEAVRVDWDNYPELVTLTQGRFHHRNLPDGRVRGWIDLPGSEYRIVRVGEWLVRDGDDWVGLTDEEFHHRFEEAV